MKLPSLTEIHLAENLEDGLGVGGWHYVGNRTVWSRSAEGWQKSEWAWPGERQIAGQWRCRRGRTTRKPHFDAWGSDGEYSELEEHGW